MLVSCNPNLFKTTRISLEMKQSLSRVIMCSMLVESHMCAMNRRHSMSGPLLCTRYLTSDMWCVCVSVSRVCAVYHSVEYKRLSKSIVLLKACYISPMRRAQQIGLSRMNINIKALKRRTTCNQWDTWVPSRIVCFTNIMLVCDIIVNHHKSEIIKHHHHQQLWQFHQQHPFQNLYSTPIFTSSKSQMGNPLRP